MWLSILTIYLIIGVILGLAGAQFSKVKYSQIIYIMVATLWLPLLVYLALGGRGADDDPDE